MSNTVSLARFLPRTRAEGPGERTAIWVQGCSIRCPGCFNPHMWTFRGGEQVPPDELAARVLAANTDGLTLLGGEPFDQAEALAEVALRVRQAGQSVMTFTGYTRAELKQAVESGRPDVAALLSQTDLLAAGPFIADQIDRERPWVGSTNQELVLLSNRFPHLLDELQQTPDRVEITVDTAGQLAVNGWATLDALDALLSELDARSLSGARGRDRASLW
ncbi:MAG: anaerobic ribonucleoside-triphosphate reductase activating protein [Micromonosporaceae bacterium]|nr:anaerobic ribonucleoside-triphosphate reductase activating protein [Micromonosporaceae bacterium]